MTQILTDVQVERLTEAVHEILGPAFGDAASRLDVSTRRQLRFQAVAARCRLSRGQLHLHVKEVAVRLNVPKYRVIAIERGRLSEIRPDVLTRYVAFLGLDAWLRCWIRANRAMAIELGLVRSGSASRTNVAASSRPPRTPSDPTLEPTAPARSRAPRPSAKR